MKVNRPAMVITEVDRENCSVLLVVNGHPVIAECTPEPNTDVYGDIKRILISAVAQQYG